MIQNFFFFLAISVILLPACGGDLENAEKIQPRAEQQQQQPSAELTPTQQLKSSAIREDDVLGQAKYSLGALQSAYNASKNTVVGQGDVTVQLAEDFTLSIQNNVDGDSYEQRVNLTALSADLKSFEWIVDNEDVPNPGVKIPVLSGQDGVQRLKNGTVESTEDYLEIILSDRVMVQKVVSGLLHAIRASRGEALEQ